MIRWIKKLFHKKEVKFNKSEHIERDTKCDKCEFLESCILCGNVIECTSGEDTKRHYIKGLVSECKKE